MDVVRLNSTTFLEDKLIENYDSMIWTERFLEASEFELKTTKIADGLADLPLDSLISLRDTKELMIVESREISTQDEGPDELIIKGRSFVTFLEDRPALYNTFPPFNILVPGDDERTWEFTSTNPGAMVKSVIDHMITSGGDFPYEVTPNVYANNSSTLTTASTKYKIPRGQLYPAVIDILGGVGLGIRSIRPIWTDSDIFIDIYHGLDRTVHQGTNTPVVFRVDAGHITDAKYLSTIKDFKNTAYVFGAYTVVVVTSPGTPSSVSGRDRKVLYVDAPDVKITTGDYGAAILASRGRQELAKHNQKNFLDGEISLITPYKYKVHYGLGDWVTLAAEYGLTDSVLINEYIRTQDKDGERGYPTFAPST